MPKSKNELNADEVDAQHGEALPERRAMSLIHTDAAAGLTIVSDDSTAVVGDAEGGPDDEAA